MFEDRILFYIDILGFTNFILTKDGRYNEVIKKSMDSILKISQLFDERLGTKINVNTSIMSDSIVCSFKLGNKKYNIINLTSILMACTGFQLSLLSKGILSRGSIVRAGLNHMENIVYGPAMIYAYDLERKVANYPRVIIDAKVSELITGYNVPGINKFIGQDFDGKEYVNYLDLIEEYDIDRESIRKEIRKIYNKTEGRVKEKYNWVKERI